MKAHILMHLVETHLNVTFIRECSYAYIVYTRICCKNCRYDPTLTKFLTQIGGTNS
jgi:hypothetical protein